MAVTMTETIKIIENEYETYLYPNCFVFIFGTKQSFKFMVNAKMDVSISSYIPFDSNKNNKHQPSSNSSASVNSSSSLNSLWPSIILNAKNSKMIMEIIAINHWIIQNMTHHH